MGGGKGGDIWACEWNRKLYFGLGLEKIFDRKGLLEVLKMYSVNSKFWDTVESFYKETCEIEW